MRKDELSYNFSMLEGKLENMAEKARNFAQPEKFRNAAFQRGDTEDGVFLALRSKSADF